MKTSEKRVVETLTAHGLKPSLQRVAILDYLQSHNTHPTVDDVYKALSPKIPTLSKTTVYNTLRLFAGHRVAQMLTMDEHRVCYDGVTQPHVHFVCKVCGRIYDIDDRRAPELKAEHENVDGNEADEVQLFYKGVCAACLQKQHAQQNN